MPAPPPRFPVICGPTAGGKSSLAAEVARRVRELGRQPLILAADAFQVYRGMDIGTAKPTAAERSVLPHRLIDLVEPAATFTVDQWLKAAGEAIRTTRDTGGVPIVVGGTHLYIKALLDGLFEGPAADAALRAELLALEPSARRAELERVDPVAAARIHPNDVRRAVRALEVFRLTGIPISAHQRQWDAEASPDALGGWGGPRRAALLVIVERPVDSLNRRINARVRRMMELGLLDEVRSLAGQPGGLGPQASEALGYKQLLEHMRDPQRVPLVDAVERIKIETRRFAKNQRTWLRRLSVAPGAMTVDLDAVTVEEAARLVMDALVPPVT